MMKDDIKKGLLDNAEKLTLNFISSNVFTCAH